VRDLKARKMKVIRALPRGTLRPRHLNSNLLIFGLKSSISSRVYNCVFSSKSRYFCMLPVIITCVIIMVVIIMIRVTW
jgi:hypothetical protein